MEKRGAFSAIRVEAEEGQPLLHLTKPWEGLEVGTEVAPVWQGKPNLAPAGSREVLVMSGPR